MLVFASCKNDFEMEKPSEKSVSDLTGETSYYQGSCTNSSCAYYYNSYKSQPHWHVTLNWFYDSADPAEYLVVCRQDGSDEVYKIKSGSLSTFESHSLTDTWKNPGKYTYTVYTVGNGYSTSASASVTVNCQYPSYNGGGSGGSGSSSGGSSSLSGTSWTSSNNKITLKFSGSSVDYVTNGSTQNFEYSYSSGSGTFSLANMPMGTFDVKGNELTWYMQGLPATFYKD